MAKKKEVFPAFAIGVFILAILWILGDLGVITIKIPWFPIIIGVVALGAIINFYANKK